MSSELVHVESYRQVQADFLISRYPVTRSEYQELMSCSTPDPEGTRYAQRSTWMDAIRYCNRLSARVGLPPSYDEATGILVDESGTAANDIALVRGVRLPTWTEWEHAAQGWSGSNGGAYLDLIRSTYVLFGMPGAPPPSSEIYTHGKSEIANLEVNTIGLHGMLGNAHEWVSDCETAGAVRNKMCYWDDVIVNYNNDISYQVRKKVAGDTDLHHFRIVMVSQEQAATLRALARS